MSTGPSLNSSGVRSVSTNLHCIRIAIGGVPRTRTCPPARANKAKAAASGPFAALATTDSLSKGAGNRYSSVRSVGPQADWTGDGGGVDMDYPYDLGPYPRKVTTSSADAQRWFNRGRNWCFGFHHEEAVACFEKALAADPSCVREAAGRRRGDAGGRDRLPPWRVRCVLCPSPRRHRAGGRLALRRALGLDAADPPCARCAAAGARSRGGGGASIARISASAERCPARSSIRTNLWALRGLLDCLERRGETAEAALIRQRTGFAAARADLPVSVSCFCARGKAA